MGKREEDHRIKQLKENGIYPYSISKLNAIDGCLREAYYIYRKDDRGMNNIYGILGGKIHDTLEEIYNDRASSGDLYPSLKSELDDMNMLGIEFPKDSQGGSIIGDNWVLDMTHFCDHFEKMQGDFSTEELVILKISDTRYLIGYIDLIQLVDNDKKIINIYDFKTSTKFKTADLLHHGRQLIVYAMAKEQEGYQIGEIAWIMLKYVDITYEWYKRANSKNKSTITKMIQRCKIGSTLKNVAEAMMDEAGYDEISTEIYLNNFVSSNSFSVLPEDIADQFSMTQSKVLYPYTDELKEEAFEYINSRADTFERLWNLDKSEWKPVEITKKQMFYCNNLCSRRKKCEELKEYKDKELRTDCESNADALF